MKKTPQPDFPKNYNHQAIEKKWQKIWEKTKLNQLDLQAAKKPFYNLMMYPYPSAEGLHVGNMYAFTGADIYGRFMRMRGFDVFEPIGFDSGGIHSENFAIKMGIHPKKMTAKNVANFTKQLHKIGAMYDWSRTVDAMNPDYYRWTQWIFTKLFEKGLAYKKSALVTWCPSCKTTVSDEQTERKTKKQKAKSKTDVKEEVIIVCERCKTMVEKRQMKQWFFRITDYAERLLDNIEKLNWPQKVLTAQRNWIGKSQGAEITFKLETAAQTLKVFTTRPDTLFGCTFLCLAPENPLVDQITTKENMETVGNYCRASLNKTEQERKAEDKDKIGVFSGAYAINPVNGQKIPIWVADYVLMDYGEGAVMGVPAHDQRDFVFAQKYNLPIIEVIRQGTVPGQGQSLAGKAHTGPGEIVNSQSWNGWRYPDDLDKVLDWLKKKKIGRKKTTYKLRDWCISRQRYWGPPIPMIFCQDCAARIKHHTSKIKNLSKGEKENPGWFAVPPENLPVLLPDIDDYLPDGSGKAPLARHPEFFETKCPKCGGQAQRETDVSDTFLDSSWYFLAYPNRGAREFEEPIVQKGTASDQKQKKSLIKPFNEQLTNKWLSVDQYTGGAEHSVLHLMYSRFITMALKDMGYLNFPAKGGLSDEPFPNFYAHGLIIKDGAKMSKSRGNVVNPDEYIEKYGADVFRLYLMFIGPFSQGGDFRDTGIKGISRFVNKIHLLAQKSLVNHNAEVGPMHRKLWQALEKTTLIVGHDISRFKYNTAIARLMEFVNLWSTLIDKSGLKIAERFALLLAPFMPHLAEEIWQAVNGKKNSLANFSSVHQQSWPKVDKNQIKAKKVVFIVQVNGKKRADFVFTLRQAKEKEIILKKVLASSKIQAYLKNKKIKKTIFVPGKLVNFVVG